MAGEKGAFQSALDEIDSTKSISTKSAKPEPKARALPMREPQKAEPKVAIEDAPNRRRKKKRATRTVPFSQRVDSDVVDYLYDIANQEDWTMNSTLRRAAKALAQSRDDKLSLKVKDEL